MDRVTHSIVETHGRNITPDGCIFLVAAAHRLTVEVALSQWLFKPGALDLIHVDWTDACRDENQAGTLNIFNPVEPIITVIMTNNRLEQSPCS